MPDPPSSTVQIAAQVALTPATDTPQTALGLMPAQISFGTASLTYTAVLGTLAPVSLHCPSGRLDRRLYSR